MNYVNLPVYLISPRNTQGSYCQIWTWLGMWPHLTKSSTSNKLWSRLTKSMTFEVSLSWWLYLYAEPKISIDSLQIYLLSKNPAMWLDQRLFWSINWNSMHYIIKTKLLWKWGNYPYFGGVGVCRRGGCYKSVSY